VETRLELVRTYLGPAPAYFSKDMVLGRVTTHLGLEPKSATPSGDGIELTLANSGGEERKFQADHVICATGYKSTLAGLPFMTPDLLRRIKSVAGTPVLNTQFESSVPGLYFVGALAANSFGPVVRFACGAEFAAPRLARRLARIHSKRVPQASPAAGTADPYSSSARQTAPASSGEGR
jgi:thioredoxin reductase